jgi:hypothetical protein
MLEIGTKVGLPLQTQITQMKSFWKNIETNFIIFSIQFRLVYFVQGFNLIGCNNLATLRQKNDDKELAEKI